MQTITDSYAAYLYVSGASPATIRHRTQTIKRLCAAGLNPLDCSASDLIRWLARFPSPATRHSYRSALRTFYTWAVMFSQVDKDPMVMIPKVKVPRTMPRPVSDKTLARLLDLATGETRAVVSLMAYCGLRGAEACNVSTRDFYRSGDVWRLRVTKPKGGGTQTVPVPSWLVERTRDHFPIVASYETMIHRISYLLASIEPGATPHSLRHWYATTALNQSGNVRIVQELLRHKSLSSTQIYTQVTNSDASAVAEGLPHIDGLT